MTRRITVVLTIDDKGGMTFFGKRQSRDRVLIGELCDSIGCPIYVNSFSAFLFRDRTECIRLSEDPLAECPDGGAVFVENLALSPYFGEIGEIILYKWNTVYPADRRIDISFSDFDVISKKEFAGSSHDKITKLTLRRKNEE